VELVPVGVVAGAVVAGAAAELAGAELAGAAAVVAGAAAVVAGAVAEVADAVVELVPDGSVAGAVAGAKVGGAAAELTDVTADCGEVAACACRENTSKTASIPAAKIATCTARRAMCRKIAWDTSSSRSVGRDRPDRPFRLNRQT
jgi:hypothetical protein